MARTIQIRVITNEGEAIADDAVSIRAPGEVGYLGVLYNHAPLVTTLVPGTLRWRRASGEQLEAAVGGGVLEVVHNHVTVLTESVSAPTASSERQAMA